MPSGAVCYLFLVSMILGGSANGHLSLLLGSKRVKVTNRLEKQCSKLLLKEIFSCIGGHETTIEGKKHHLCFLIFGCHLISHCLDSGSYMLLVNHKNIFL